MTDSDFAQTRATGTDLPGPQSYLMHQRKQKAVAPGIHSQNPIYVADVEGGILRDLDGNSFVDFGSGIGTTTVGLSAPRVVEAVQKQAAKFIHTAFMTTPYEQYVEVCELLNEITPGSHTKTSALFNSGSEAVENAIKLARAYTGKPAVAAFEHAFHGRTNLTLALTAKDVPYKSGFGPFAPEVYRIPMSYPFRDGLTGDQAAERTITALEKQVSADSLACVIIEPIQGEGGFIVPAPGYLSILEQWCKDNNVVFIADEVQCGYARTGRMFASEYEDIVPDIVCTAKGIAGGMPLSAVTGRKEIMASAVPGSLGGTFGGNPVSCAAALAVIETIDEENLLAKALHMETVIRTYLEHLQEDDKRVGDVRGRGAMMALELVDPRTSEPDEALAKRVQYVAYKRGLLILTCGTYKNVLRLLPPLVMSDELLQDSLQVLVDIFKEI